MKNQDGGIVMEFGAYVKPVITVRMYLPNMIWGKEWNE